MMRQFRNADEVPARALMTFRPGRFDELISEMRQAGTAGTRDEKQRQAILTKWGIHFDEDRGSLQNACSSGL